ncbi:MULTISPECIES: Rieske (2Fe-2S) protein [Nocardioides]|uniref:Cytochrome bc1 complex Rieske iron-sulfur subunit n=1 Tax=Nocardioides vastitatis TaxID=2568655 RepID=A0ABW0ZFP6_9ACTN|nr:Rieske (2Fe-2S) protein [Nocardioides sp.]THJ03692.1 Rieske (2Fe-2S) protein [Nocardioides sp.]
MTAPLTRRRALSGAATLGVSVPLLAACGDDSDTNASDPVTSDSTPSSSAPATETTTGGGAGLVATSEVPVDGGVVLASEELVVTQPTAGQFKAFSAICTHQGCLVGSVSDGTITCPCHNSMFSAADGSVTGGPASAPLPAVPVKVTDGQVVRA